MAVTAGGRMGMAVPRGDRQVAPLGGFGRDLPKREFKGPLHAYVLIGGPPLHLRMRPYAPLIEPFRFGTRYVGDYFIDMVATVRGGALTKGSMSPMRIGRRYGVRIWNWWPEIRPPST